MIDKRLNLSTLLKRFQHPRLILQIPILVQQYRMSGNNNQMINILPWFFLPPINLCHSLNLRLKLRATNNWQRSRILELRCRFQDKWTSPCEGPDRHEDEKSKESVCHVASFIIATRGVRVTVVGGSDVAATVGGTVVGVV